MHPNLSAEMQLHAGFQSMTSFSFNYSHFRRSLILCVVDPFVVVVLFFVFVARRYTGMHAQIASMPNG